MVLNFDQISKTFIPLVILILLLDQLFHFFLVVDDYPIMMIGKPVKIHLQIHIPNPDPIRYLSNRPIKREWEFSPIESKTSVVERVIEDK